MATKQSKTGLGPRGWSIVLGSFLLYMLGTGIVTDFLNITVPAIAAEHEGWSTAVMMTFSTVAGWVTLVVATGVLSQFVPRMASLGVEQGVSVSIMSLCCFIGFPFSPLWGYLDAKFGTKRVTSFLMCLYLVGLILMILVGKNIVGTCVAICIFYAALGGINNMLTSYTTSVFGRYDFPSANKLMYPIYNVVRCCAFAIVGISAALAGGNYTVTYSLLAVCQAIAIVVSFFTKDDLIGRTGLESDAAADQSKIS